MRKEIDRVACRDDDGKNYTVVMWQHFSDRGTLEAPGRIAPTTKSLSLSTGEPVTFVDDDTFEIVESETTIRRVR